MNTSHLPEGWWGPRATIPGFHCAPGGQGIPPNQTDDPGRVREIIHTRADRVPRTKLGTWHQVCPCHVKISTGENNTKQQGRKTQLISFGGKTHRLYH